MLKLILSTLFLATQLQALPLGSATKLYSQETGSACSGFKLKNRIIVTASHCLSNKKSGMNSVEAHQEVLDEYDEYVPGRIGAGDIMFLMPKDGKLIGGISGVRRTPIKMGERLYILGTNGLSPISNMKVRTILIGYYRIGNYWGHAVGIESGMSGAGVVDSDGLLVGVITLTQGSDLAGITPVLELLD